MEDRQHLWNLLAIFEKYEEEHRRHNVFLIIEHIVQKKPELLHQRDENGCTPLILACKMQNVHSEWYELIKLFVDHGADLNSQDNKGMTPLMHICNHYHNVNYDIFKFLIDRGSNLDLQNSRKYTVLMIVYRGNERFVWCHFKMMDFVKLLVEKGCNLYLRDEHNNNVIDCHVYNYTVRNYLRSIFRNNKIRQSSLIKLCHEYLRCNKAKMLEMYMRPLVNKDIFNGMEKYGVFRKN